MIPPFQRPYEWKREHVESLFNDLWNHMMEHSEDGIDYFLGPIVTYEDKYVDKESERTIIECCVIDGQQRLTTLALLLRAIYEQIATGDSDEDLEDEESEVKKTLWTKNKETKQYNMSVNPIESRVVFKEDALIFDKIMESGSADGLEGPYAENYRLLQNLIVEQLTSKKGALKFPDFIECILKNTILLPIVADSMDTAMEIFNTLNDRGMQLTDADIFKSLIYGDLDPSKRGSFINRWNQMSKDCEKIGITIQDLFKYYSFYIKAVENDRSSSLISVRKFYSMKNRLKDKDLMDNLQLILNLYKVALGQERLIDPEQPFKDEEYKIPNILPGEEWSDDCSIRKSLDILSSFANDYWNYPIVTYYLSNKTKADFKESFDKFLHKLIVDLLYTQVIANNVNSLKTPVMNLDLKIIDNLHPEFDFGDKDWTIFKQNIVTPHFKLERMLLKIVAYMEPNQTDVMLSGWQVEHIFSQKWDPSVYSQLPAEEIKQLIEHIGNKMPLEKIPNIMAGNNFFSKKRAEYEKSDIALAHTIRQYTSWDTNSILMRDEIIVRDIQSLLESWSKEYDDAAE